MYEHAVTAASHNGTPCCTGFRQVTSPAGGVHSLGLVTMSTTRLLLSAVHPPVQKSDQCVGIAAPVPASSICVMRHQTRM